jgi:hypothetical protein
VNRHISRAAAFFEAGDAAEQRATEGDRAMARRQCRDQRFPLARRKVERQQHQRRPATTDAKRDAGEFGFLIMQAGRRERVTAFKELPHCGVDALAPIRG